MRLSLLTGWFFRPRLNVVFLGQQLRSSHLLLILIQSLPKPQIRSVTKSHLYLSSSSKPKSQ